MYNSLKSSNRSRFSASNSSSKKVRELYEEFETLKMRVNRRGSRPNQPVDSIIQGDNSPTHKRQSSFLQHKINSNHHYLAEESTLFNINEAFSKCIDAKYNRQLNAGREKNSLKEQIEQICNDFMNVNLGIFEGKVKGKMKELQRIAYKVQNCWAKMKEMKEIYQIKIKSYQEKLKQAQETQGSNSSYDSSSKDMTTFSTSTTKIVSKSMNQLQEQYRNLEEKLFIKENEIHNYKMQGKRQKRIIDHLKQKEQAINKLNQSLQHQIHLKNKEIQDLKRKLSCNSHQKIVSSQQKSAGLQFVCHPINRYSDDLQYLMKNQNYHKMLRNLQIQIDLYGQENKHLEYKKTKLEHQIRVNELDQERYLQQCTLLKEQVKRLSSNIKALDQISFEFLKNNQINRELVQKLEISLKCRQLYQIKLHQKSY